MIWVSLRRQRAQLLTLLGLLIAGAGAIALLRSSMVGTIESTRLTPCVTQALQDCAEPQAAKAFQTDWSMRLDLGRMAILSLPALIGVFIGAPLFARELEQGTHVLAFTQSVSRTRWMLSKLVIALVPALVVLIALQSLVTWWLSAAGTLGPLKNGVFTALNFGIDHVSPVGYTLFAFALGTFLGVASRRSLVAMTATLGAFVVMRFALSALTERLAPAQHLEVSPATPLDLRENGSMVIDQGWLGSTGQPVPEGRAAALVQACKSTPGGATNTQEGFLACLPQSGLAKQYADFVPAAQAWQMHLIEAAFFVGIAAALLVGTGWVLRRQS